MTNDQKVFETWVEEVSSRGVKAKKVMRGKWEELKEDMLSLLAMLKEEGLDSTEKIESLARVAFGKETVTTIFAQRSSWSILIDPHKYCMVSLSVWEMKEGPYKGQQRVAIYLPSLEYKTINDEDLGWALWFRRQMPDCLIWKG